MKPKLLIMLQIKDFSIKYCCLYIKIWKVKKGLVERECQSKTFVFKLDIYFLSYKA